MVELTIGDAHVSMSRSVADQVKPALDGVISAFHTHRGNPESISERLASTGLGEKDELQQLLQDPAWNILGSRMVVRPFGATGVQWNPADDMCVAATVQPASVETGLTAPRWRLTGRIYKAEPR